MRTSSRYQASPDTGASSSLKASDGLVHVVWASTILSLLNPSTITASDELLQPNQAVNDDDGADSESGDDLDQDFTSIDAEPLTANSEELHRKFLDCICELFANAKGVKSVTATALREKENEVEVDIARNNGLNAEDEAYLGFLKRFLAMQADDISHQALAEYSREFLGSTISYSAQRVDYQVEAVAKLFNRARFRPLQQSVSGKYTEDTCLLSCCSATQESVSTKTQSLLMLFLNFDRWRSALSTAQDRNEKRREIVELAAAVTHSQQAKQATQESLEIMVPSVDPRKAIQMWRVLAKPVASLLILSQIVRLIPNFRATTFISISSPAPFRLQNLQVQPISEAWKYLGLPSGRIPPVLVRKSRDFKRKCGSDLFTHCEIQLLTRYEAEPSLGPTLAYFGCSKKSCFLCESFLALSPLKVHTRGRHGQCHPQWAIQPCDSESTNQRLKSLCETIKHKIRAILEPRHTPPPVAIHQSSAVSELKSLDMLELTRQSQNREVADRKSQELREQRQILLNPRSVGPPNIWYQDLRSLCVICQKPCARICNRCLAIWYCSKYCQTLDWPAHKLLCPQYLKFLNSRPSEDHRLGIWFPKDTDRPRLIWAPIFSPGWGFHYPCYDNDLGPDNGMLFTIPFAENKRRGLELNHYLTVYYCDWDENINKSVQAAVQACLGMTTPNNMVGNYVVMSGQHGSYTGTPDHEFRDMTLADFRHALDWFSTCFDDTVRETPCGGSVRAVKVSCPLEQTIYGRDLFTSVAVDRDFPSTSEVSPISQALGLPIRVCQLEQDYLKQAIKLEDEASGEEEEEERWTNPYARALMTDIDLESENWGKTRQHWDIDGSFLLIRADREDMDFALAKHMSCYCFDVLKPLFERTLSGEISRQDVLEEITFDKAMAWKLVDASTGVAAEPRPQRGFVRRIGSQSWEDARQHCHVLNVADKILKEVKGS